MSLVSVSISNLFFALLLSLPVFQGPIKPVPGTYPAFPRAGDTVFRGRLNEICIDLPVYIYLGGGPDGILLGRSLVDVDGTFVVTLTRPLAEGDIITVYAECRKDAYVWDTFSVAPPIVPEPTTLILVGSGLGVLAWKARRRLRRMMPLVAPEVINTQSVSSRE